MNPAVLRPALSRWSGYFLLSVLLMLLIAHAVGAALDFAASIRYPYELDYGEGIVWQQGMLIPGPRMYSPSPDLPFIVFHYPPVFYLLSRLALLAQPDFLAAGRLVSGVSALLIGPSVMGLVLLAARRPGRALRGFEVALALAAGLLAISVHAVRTWGLTARVDMAGIALCMAGLCLGAWADGRFRGTALALLLCVAAVFAKQTLLPAGIAVFLVALLRNPRGALAAALVAGTAGLAALGLMQWLTGGGFLQNIIGYNINRYSLRHVYWVFWPERWSLPIVALMAVSYVLVARRLLPGGMIRTAPWRAFAALRQADRATACRLLILVHATLAGLMLFTVFKSGGNFNYLLEFLCAGCVLVGILLIDLTRSAAWGGRWFHAVAAVLVVWLALMPVRQMPDTVSAAELDRHTVLVRRIAMATKPVASENMTLLMRAGKPVIFEPSIVSELASVGRWDEKPLVDMIRRGDFAFMITTDNAVGGTARRTPAVDAAMRAAYPRVEQVSHRLWFNLPPE